MSCPIHSSDWSCAGCVKARLGNKNKRLESRWAALKDIFHVTIDNYDDLPEFDMDVVFARSVIEEMDKLEGEG